MIHKHTGRWMCQGSVSPDSQLVEGIPHSYLAKGITDSHLVEGTEVLTPYALEQNLSEILIVFFIKSIVISLKHVAGVFFY